MAIWGCGLHACCCQPAVAGGFIYADLRSELSTHLALQALFTKSSPVCEPLLQAFPFPSTLGEVTLHQLSQAWVFIYSSCWRWVFPLLLWSFPPTATFTSFPVLGCWAGAATPAFSGRFVYLQFRCGIHDLKMLPFHSDLWKNFLCSLIHRKFFNLLGDQFIHCSFGLCLIHVISKKSLLTQCHEVILLSFPLRIFYFLVVCWGFWSILSLLVYVV
jgi:hypothetical protein